MQTVKLRDLALFSGEQFVEQCYLKLLSRQPDPVGRQHYRSMLENGKSKISVIRSMIKSKEARKLGVRVDGLWLKAIAENATQIPVLGALYSAVWLLANASSTLREIRAGRELALGSQGRIQALEASIDKLRDLDAVLNSVASTHGYMREVQRRLSALEPALSNNGVADSRVDALECEISSIAQFVRETHLVLDPLRNMASSLPAALRDHSIKLAALRQQIGEQGAAGWDRSLNGRLEHALSAIGVQEELLVRLTSDASTMERAAVDDIFERLGSNLTLVKAAEARMNAMSDRLDDQIRRAEQDVQRVDRSIETTAAQSARLDLNSEMIGALRASLAQTTEDIEFDRAERSQLTSRLNYAVENLAGQGDDLQALRRAIAHGKEEGAAQSSELSVGTQKLRDDIGRLAREIGGIHSSLHGVYNRIEFIRRETLFEMKYGSVSAFAAPPEVPVARLVNGQRVEAARAGQLKLNVGCGHLPLDGYINIDRREVHGVDVIAEATGIPFEQHEVSVIRAAHLIEHFPQEQLRREVLPHWRYLLKAGGKLNLVVPDVEHMFGEYYRGTYPYENFRDVLFGGQEYGGDFHYNMFMPAQLSMLLSEAGFRTVRWLARGRVNGQCFEMELEAE